MFILGKKTCQNRAFLSVWARFLEGGREGITGVDYLVQIFKFSERKNFRK
jgi:hypothetical protein